MPSSGGFSISNLPAYCSWPQWQGYERLHGFQQAEQWCSQYYPPTQGSTKRVIVKGGAIEKDDEELKKTISSSYCPRGNYLCHVMRDLVRNEDRGRHDLAASACACITATPASTIITVPTSSHHSSSTRHPCPSSTHSSTHSQSSLPSTLQSSTHSQSSSPSSLQSSTGNQTPSSTASSIYMTSGSSTQSGSPVSTQPSTLSTTASLSTSVASESTNTQSEISTATSATSSSVSLPSVTVPPFRFFYTGQPISFHVLAPGTPYDGVFASLENYDVVVFNIPGVDTTNPILQTAAFTLNTGTGALSTTNGLQGNAAEYPIITNTGGSNDVVFSNPSTYDMFAPYSTLFCGIDPATAFLTCSYAVNHVAVAAVFSICPYDDRTGYNNVLNIGGTPSASCTAVHLVASDINTYIPPAPFTIQVTPGSSATYSGLVATIVPVASNIAGYAGSTYTIVFSATTSPGIFNIQPNSYLYSSQAGSNLAATEYSANGQNEQTDYDVFFSTAPPSNPYNVHCSIENVDFKLTCSALFNQVMQICPTDSANTGLTNVFMIAGNVLPGCESVGLTAVPA